MLDHDKYQHITVVDVTDRTTKQKQTVEISFTLQNHNQYNLTVANSPVDGQLHRQSSCYQKSTNTELTKKLLDRAIQGLLNFPHLSRLELKELQDNSAFLFLIRCFGVKV